MREDILKDLQKKSERKVMNDVIQDLKFMFRVLELETHPANTAGASVAEAMQEFSMLFAFLQRMDRHDNMLGSIGVFTMGLSAAKAKGNPAGVNASVNGVYIFSLVEADHAFCSRGLWLGIGLTCSCFVSQASCRCLVNLAGSSPIRSRGVRSLTSWAHQHHLPVPSRAVINGLHQTVSTEGMLST